MDAVYSITLECQTNNDNCTTRTNRLRIHVNYNRDICRPQGNFDALRNICSRICQDNLDCPGHSDINDIV